MNQLLEQFGINSTIWIQMGIFLALVSILKPLFFNPFLKLIELRKQKTTEGLEAAQELLDQINDRVKEYEKKLALERKHLQQEFDQKAEQQQRAHEEAINGLRLQARNVVETTLQELEHQGERIQSELAQKLPELSQELYQKLKSS